MMSSNRRDYGSAAEWLAALRQDDAWLCQLQRLQDSTENDFNIHRDDAIRRIGNGETYEFWDIYQHKIEPVLAEVWQIAELSLIKLKIQTIGMLSIEWMEQHGGINKVVPERLKTDEAKELLADLVDAGMLTENWQPNGLSGTERALVAKAVSDRLEVNEVWQLFGQLWGEKPETLRAYYNKAMEQKKSLKYLDKLKNILD
jgi:hypothetical protein